MTTSSPAASVPSAPTLRAPHVPEIPDTLKAAVGTVMGRTADAALAAFRSAAWNAFAAQGIPGSKHEDFSFVSAADLKASLTRAPGEAPTPQVEGEGFEFIPMTELESHLASNENDIPAALACALATYPVTVEVPAGRQASLKIALPVASGDARADHAVFIRLGRDAEATVTLSVEGLTSGGFLNAAVYLSVAPNARLRVYQADARDGIQMLKLRFDADKDSSVELLSTSAGSRLARLTIEADLKAPGAILDLRGAAAVGGSNRVHRHLRIRHAAPDCVSKQLFKAVVTGAGRSSVDGTVIVERGAQRTDARQLLQHQLLSPDGRADAKPRLLIHADDVKCSHGATVGKTDPAQLFYLLSRGLDRATAGALLTKAFLGEALDIAPEDVREAAREALISVLNRKGET